MNNEHINETDSIIISERKEEEKCKPPSRIRLGEYIDKETKELIIKKFHNTRFWYRFFDFYCYPNKNDSGYNELEISSDLCFFSSMEIITELEQCQSLILSPIVDDFSFFEFEPYEPLMEIKYLLVDMLIKNIYIKTVLKLDRSHEDKLQLAKFANCN